MDLIADDDNIGDEHEAYEAPPLSFRDELEVARLGRKISVVSIWCFAYVFCAMGASAFWFDQKADAWDAVTWVQTFGFVLAFLTYFAYSYKVQARHAEFSVIALTLVALGTLPLNIFYIVRIFFIWKLCFF